MFSRVTFPKMTLSAVKMGISRKWVESASYALTTGTVGGVLSPLLHAL
jgi:hypothetical protein